MGDILNPEVKLGFSKAVYEFRGEDDAVPEANPALEEQFFGEEHHLLSGLNFDKYSALEVRVKPVGNIPDLPQPSSSFEEMKLHPQVVGNIKLARYDKPTPVQKHAIPAILKGYDIMGHAQTGSGKTAAFLVPVISRLLNKQATLARKIKDFGGRRAEPYVVVLCPTRELANQIFDECRRFCYRTRFRPGVIYGGGSAVEQKEIMRRGCDVLIATPGRLKDFLERGCVSLQKVKALVLDEADRMLTMGFDDDIRTIAQKSEMPDVEERQTSMFSATLPKDVRKLAQDFLKEDFLFISVGRVGAAEKNVHQEILNVEYNDKRDKLYDLLMTSQPKGRTLVFVDSKRMADTIDDFLFNKGLPCTSLHGDRSQAEREDALESFRKGKCPIMIATEIAARGLDIKDVVRVINFDCPKDIDSYVHRIGRTARAGNVGFATTFYNERDEAMGPELTKILVESETDVPEFLKEFVTDELEYDDVQDADFEEDGEEDTLNLSAAPTTVGNMTSWDAKPADGEAGGGNWSAGGMAAVGNGNDNWN